MIPIMVAQEKDCVSSCKYNWKGNNLEGATKIHKYLKKNNIERYNKKLD